MDVQCERCKAEYEFDDALVSGRGTTVKCTSCGHQFKIRRASEKPDAEPDRWAVKTTEGRELVFTSLRELQKAILARQVGRADTLTRGGGPPRALGAITELEPFFEEAAETSSPSGLKRSPEPPRPSGAPRADAKRTSIGTGGLAPVPPKRNSSRPPPAYGGRTGPALRPIPTPTPPPQVAMRPRIDTIRPPLTTAAVPPPPPSTVPRPIGSLPDDSGEMAVPKNVAAVSVAPVLTAGDLIPDSEQQPTRTEHTPPMPLHSSAVPPPPPPMTRSTAPRTMIHAPASAPPLPARAMSSAPPPVVHVERPPPPTIQVETSSGLPPPTVPVKVEEARGQLPSIDEVSGDITLPGHPRRVGGWVVAVVLVLGASVLGFAVAKPYLDAKAAQNAAAASALDPRAQQMLADGERALAAGDLEAANDAFQKASALAEKDPRVLLALARLAVVRADVPWLRLRVLASDAADDQRTTTAQLGELAARAKKAAEDATAAAPDQASAVLVKIDALRIGGDGPAARALVSKVIQGASQPETAYALAALDLAEPEPLWPMVIERLRLAAAGEGNGGRARAALVYALARSGDSAGAKAELEKLSSLARPYPLVGPLRAFVAKVPEAKDGGGAARATPGDTGARAAATSPASVDVSSLPHPAPAGGRGTWAGGGGGGGGGGSVAYAGANDPRFLLAQAESAKASRDWDRARALYSSALAQNANDSEALAGLGDVDKAQRDLPGAATYYKRALSVNPVYLPALVGLGDVEWESGDKDEAQKTYRDIADRFPDGTYPGRVKQRANDSSGGPSAAPAPTATSTAAPPADTTGASP